MRLIDADVAKAELLKMADEIHADTAGGFFDGIKSGYQSAADRLDTMVTACEHGRWIEIDLDTSICSLCKNPQDYETTYCPYCGAIMDEEG